MPGSSPLVEVCPTLPLMCHPRTPHNNLTILYPILSLYTAIATDNPFFASDPSSRPQADSLDSSDFLGVNCLIYPQTAVAGMVGIVRGIRSGRRNANCRTSFWLEAGSDARAED